MAQDKLFGRIEAWHGDAPWGEVLDAGTGDHSLGWICGLPTARWSAVTGDEAVAASLRERLGGRMRPQDEVLSGNWTDPGLLEGRRFEVVVADYLLGAVDGFAPYFQGQLFARLRPLVGRWLYVVGLEPFEERCHDLGGALLLEIARLRDACILLAGHRCYREYPLEWVERSLAASGFEVTRRERVPILFGERYVRGQLGVCRRKLPLLADRGLARELERSVEALERRALRHLELHGRIPWGEDYVVQAAAR